MLSAVAPDSEVVCIISEALSVFYLRAMKRGAGGGGGRFVWRKIRAAKDDSMRFSGSPGFPRRPLCLRIFCNEASCLGHKRPYLGRDRFIQRGAQQLASNSEPCPEAQ